MISTHDYLYFVDDALGGMVDIVEALGDDLANQRPPFPSANSPFATLTHCVGVMEYWVGEHVAGRSVERDRDAEFRATGSVADLVERLREVRRRFGLDVEHLDPNAPLRGTPEGWEGETHPFLDRQGAVLIHVFEELARHRGQMEGERDALLYLKGDNHG